ncbi:MAG: hypothetical protein EA360_03165 [Balneolaceae bacterium]|nr:MAG: hypothetical protein EA360_03165 [Balneolaceae bacterium]
MFMKLSHSTVLLLILLLLSSCITSNRDQEQRRLALYFFANNVGSEISIGDANLIISEFKFSLDRFNLYTANDLTLQTSADVTALIYSYDQNISGDRLILDVDLGFRDIDRFTGYELFVEPPSSRTGVLDGDFFGQDTNFSVIIRGTVDELDFTFRSSLSFTNEYDFIVDVGGREETLIIRNLIDVEDVFTDSDGSFLNPVLSANEQKIVGNIESKLRVQASSGTVFEVIP